MKRRRSAANAKQEPGKVQIEVIPPASLDVEFSVEVVRQRMVEYCRSVAHWQEPVQQTLVHQGECHVPGAF